MSEALKAPVTYLLEVEAAEYLRMSVGLLQEKRRKGAGPRFRRHGRLVCYTVADLDTWSDAQARGGADRKDDHDARGARAARAALAVCKAEGTTEFADRLAAIAKAESRS